MRFPGRPTIRRRILLFQAIVAIAVVSMFAAAAIANRNYGYHLARGELAYRQLEAVSSLARLVDQYSERIALMLATDTRDRTDIARLHSRIAGELAHLDRATREEYAFLTRHRSAETDQDDFSRLARLQQLHADMDLRVEPLLAMRDAGRPETAARIFHRSVASGLNDEFEQLIDAAVADELAEIAAADSEARELARTLGLLLGITAAFMLSGVLIAGYFLYRAIVDPIGRLISGAVAVGHGDLSVRVGALRPDEFGLLARRFDEMVARLDAQQKALLEARSDLEGKVATRTAELASSNKLLDERDQSRVRFLADISHELRTPLTVLRGEAEVALRGKSAGAPQDREALRRIADHARDMARLVDDLMVLARSETDDIALEKELLDLGDIARAAGREAGLLGQARHVRVETAIEGLPVVEGDQQRMKQIFMIILENAVKYSERGGIVTLGLAGDAETVTVTVRNRSEHLQDEDLPRLFDRFYRGRDAAAHGYGGSGLGLAIAKWLVERQGGSIMLTRETDLIAVTIRFPAASRFVELLPSATQPLYARKTAEGSV